MKSATQKTFYRKWTNINKASAGRVLGAIALTLFGLTACAAPPTESAADSAPTEAPTEVPTEADAAPTDAAAEEAAKRAEWEAQMATIREVLDGKDRADLISNAATKGPADADVILIKFSDFECPFCAVAAADMKDFTEAHSDDVLYVYKHFPLTSIHDEAMPAAKATWAAAQQDQFWIYHDGLFAYQEKLGEDYYVELAEQVGLDVEQFNRDRNSPEAQAAVEADLALAKDLNLRGTPSFLMTNLTDSILLPGGAPQELYAEALERLKASAAQ
ncbi:MAG: thioredoxin domain-containing protein [Cyanobacteria bacterium J06607_13]